MMAYCPYLQPQICVLVWFWLLSFVVLVFLVLLLAIEAAVSLFFIEVENVGFVHIVKRQRLVSNFTCEALSRRWLFTPSFSRRGRGTLLSWVQYTCACCMLVILARCGHDDTSVIQVMSSNSKSRVYLLGSPTWVGNK